MHDSVCIKEGYKSSLLVCVLAIQSRCFSAFRLDEQFSKCSVHKPQDLGVNGFISSTLGAADHHVF